MRLSIATAAAVALALITAMPALAKPGRDKGSGDTEITSKRLEYEYKDSVILFEEEVHVKDPEYDLLADRVLVFLDGTNEVKSVRAMGNVVVTSGERTAKCSQAIYTRADGKIVMTGNDAMLSNGEDTIWGKQITIWVDDERIECHPVRVILPSKGKSAPGKEGAK